jgi:SAM-dependent methyltransferase
MRTNKNAWANWYPAKEDKIDEDMPKLAKVFSDNGVSRILDLGCGTGRHTIYFAERRFDVYGFDFSPYAVRRSMERLKERSLSGHLIVVDMRKKFPYENKFFEAVIAIKVIHHARVGVIKHVFSEVSRILKKGGYLYLQVPTLERNAQYEEGVNIEPGTRVPLEGPERGIPHHGFTRKEVGELLNDYNFDIEEMNERDEHYNILAVKRC